MLSIGLKSFFCKGLSFFKRCKVTIDCDSSQSEGIEKEEKWQLTSLTANYQPAHHQKYVQAINNALSDCNVFNIALTGGYGVGKSSILKEVVKRQKDNIIELSLSTLAPFEDTDNDGVPKQATTKTNRIQQEIVKQLLYSEKPSKTPSSRFYRIEKFQHLQEIVFACVFGVLASIIFMLTGWSKDLAYELFPNSIHNASVHIIAFLTLGALFYVIRLLSHGRIHIKQLQTGPAIVTLNETAPSFFDQYLDEIVYYFAVSKTEVVIFEDIDRFNDAYIFETLRSLNVLLNKSPQIKKSVRFIYAIKDSIFDQLGIANEGRAKNALDLAVTDPATQEMVRANRTKFFDIVIPVVPFITHLNAKSLVHKLLGEIQHNIDSRLIDIAARYVPDMRLLINVRNEFIVFRGQLFSGDGQSLRLNESDLFAMILYKCTHLDDFEKIRLSESKLDNLYREWRKFTSYNISLTEGKIREVLKKLNSHETLTILCEKLGERLCELMPLLLSVSDFSTFRQLEFDGNTINNEELKTYDFWEKFARNADSAKLVWRNTRQSTSNPASKLSLSWKDVSVLLDTSIDPSEWKQQEADELNSQLESLRGDLDFLKRSDIGALFKYQNTRFYNDKGQSLRGIAIDTLTSDLAYALVDSGYINRNFTLYTSTFHGNRVTPDAMNFIIHNVQTNVMDEYFSLSVRDVDALLAEISPEQWNEQCFYNISILDTLIKKGASALSTLIGSLKELGDQETQFLQAYLSSGEEKVNFGKIFAYNSEYAIQYLITSLELELSERLILVSAALDGLNPKKQYYINEDSADFLNEHYMKFNVLTKSASKASINLIADIFAKANIRVQKLALLSQAVQKVFIKRNLYIINKENLEIIFVNETNYSLDNAFINSKETYEYLIDHLAHYLQALSELSSDKAISISRREYISDIINDALEKNSKLYVESLLYFVSKDFLIFDLGKLNEDIWPALAEHKLFTPTFNNISKYISVNKKVDSDLAGLLESAEKINGFEQISETSKQKLAISILSTPGYLLTPHSRVTLINGLELEDYIPVSQIPLEEGDLFALLIEKNLIEDIHSTYEYISSLNWNTKESFIATSNNFESYIVLSDLADGDIASILQSKKIADSVKLEIIKLANKNPDYCESDDFLEIAKVALDKGYALETDFVEAMSLVVEAAELVIKSLGPNLSLISKDQLFRILNNLNGEYSKLTYVGHKVPKIPNTPLNRTLLDLLKSYGIVNSYDDDSDPIKVRKKRK